MSLLKSSNPAHSSGRTCIVLLNDRQVATAGSDGEIAIHEIDSVQLKQTIHKRVHKGAIKNIYNINNSRLASVGEDGFLYSTEISSQSIMTSKLLYQATLPLKQVSYHNGLVACSGDEGKVAIVPLDGGDILFIEEIFKSPIVGLYFINNMLMVAFEDGKISKYKVNTTSLELVKSVELNCAFDPAGVHLFHRKNKLFLCCPQNGLFIFEEESLVFIDQIKPPQYTNFIACLLDDKIILAHQEGYCICKLGDGFDDNDFGEDIFWSFTMEGDVNGIGNDSNTLDGDIFITTTEGLLYHLLITATKNDIKSILDTDIEDEDEEEQIVVKKKKKEETKKFYIDDQLFSNDDEEEEEDRDGDEENDNDKEKKGKKRDKWNEKKGIGKGRNSFNNDILKDYDVPSEEDDDNNGNNIKADSGVRFNYSSNESNAMPRTIHQSFQPASTPLINGYRFLAWNAVGLIVSRQDDGYCSVEVEFHDKAFHHPIRFIDEYGYTMAAVGKAGTIFAKSGDRNNNDLCDKSPSKFHICPITTWTKTPSFTMDMNDGAEDEDIVGVAIGNGKYAILATSHGYLRTISVNAIQGPIVNYSGKFVSMIASDRHLLLITTDEFTSQLLFTIYCLDTMIIICNGDIGGRFRNQRIKWIGFSSLENDNDQTPIVGLFDASQTLFICDPNMNYQWRPWFDGSKYDKKIWPVAFNESDLTCIVLDEGEREDFPEPVPRPLVSFIPLKIPFMCINTDPLVAPIERSIRTKQLLSSKSSSMMMNSEKESRKLKLEADKHVLELIQLAIKSERLTRVLELCEFFLLEKSWDIAVQLAKHNRLAILANRIEELKDQLSKESNQSSAMIVDKKYESPIVRTPRLPKRIAQESPATVLANLTPLYKRNDDDEQQQRHQQYARSASPEGQQQQQQQQQQNSYNQIDQHDINQLITKDHSLEKSPEKQGAHHLNNNEPKTLAELLKMVKVTNDNSNAINPEPSKKVKLLSSELNNGSIVKSKKQADISYFAKKVAINLGQGSEETQRDENIDDNVNVVDY